MRWPIRCHLAVGPLVVFIVLVVGMTGSATAWAAHATEPWYRDMRNHWSETYVRLLWDESVSIADTHTRYDDTYFQPDDYMQRDAWLAMLARVFGLASSSKEFFRDVHWPHSLNYKTEASGQINAAGFAGFWDHYYLYPDYYFTREVAAASLIRSLGLASYAASLSTAQVNALLLPFKDRNSVSSERRPLVALAVQLKIIEGYPDGTLKPQQSIRRSEGATIVARSALIRALAAPNPFSPDGDGYQDETVFTLQGLRNRNITRWSLIVTDDRERQVWGTNGTDNRLPTTVTWTGRHDNGTELPAGTYYYQALLRDIQAQEHASVRMPLTIVYRRLSAGLAPDHLFPGDPFVVTAVTTSDSRRVSFDWDGGGAFLAARQGGTWQGQGMVPAPLPAGTYPVTVTAEFAGVNQQVTLWLTVDAKASLAGWLEPDPVAAGGTLTIGATTKGPVRAVTALFEDGQEIQLVAVDAGHWVGQYDVPLTAAARIYRVVLTAHGIDQSVELRYNVAASGLERLRIVLTD